MSNLRYPKEVYRIIDANINRVKEGLRVCEEFTRFILNDRALSSCLKNTRHKIEGLIKVLCIDKGELLGQRDIRRDVGKKILGRELVRNDLNDVFFANLQRVKESVRVLEEFSKVVDRRLGLRFKDIRYLVYDLEKKAFTKIKNLRHPGQGSA